MRLTAKVAIVTGGGGGIGRAICVHFAQEGANVLVCDINSSAAKKTASSIRESGGEADPITSDITKKEDAQVMAAQALNLKGTFLSTQAVMPA